MSVLLLMMIGHSSLSQQKKSLSVPVAVHNDSSPFKPAPLTLDDSKDVNKNWEQELLFLELPSQWEHETRMLPDENDLYRMSAQKSVMWNDEVKYYPNQPMRHERFNGHIVTMEPEALEELTSGSSSSAEPQTTTNAVELKKQYDRTLLLNQSSRGKTERFMIMDGTKLENQPVDINTRTLIPIRKH